MPGIFPCYLHQKEMEKVCVQVRKPQKQRKQIFSRNGNEEKHALKAQGIPERTRLPSSSTISLVIRTLLSMAL